MPSDLDAMRATLRIADDTLKFHHLPGRWPQPTALQQGADAILARGSDGSEQYIPRVRRNS
eukprot:2332234-Amphidinium_carterae.1